VEYSELLDELIELVREDAERLDCVAEIEHGREIVRRGTSAQRQLGIFHAAVKDGADNPEALRRVVDDLIAETVAGIDD